MSEFNNRIAAQRHILQIVNCKRWRKEELLGLSSKAIDRWISVNQLDPEAQLAKLIRTASEKLFFLANKSQDQISEDYKLISKEIMDISRKIELEIG
ncbi:MAG: hypothetical protein HY785_14080 [Oscillatoriophycideae cyanobacterium NC_groundwater_1537_Pr4_S-0.65um_50_18]|nr:hypothetical protein [Oscillatoriophycideae cyanobacterium NC_groundwater_1537_Pr4_S-0.65um_50_18]